MSDLGKTAVVTGITGQDGAYLAALLLDRGYRVFGTHRGAAPSSTWRLEELGIARHRSLHLVRHELLDGEGFLRLIERAQPREIYNLAAQSNVNLSFSEPVATGMITGLSTVHMLEAIRTLDPSIRFYQASTSEMFGRVQTVPQDELTRFHPISPYGVAKLYAHCMTVNYRESHGIFAVCGILFNHESPLRGLEFVTRKITDAVARIHNRQLDVLELGNLSAKRDWGYAREYVDGMWRMLQAPVADTFVLATGRSETVRDFVSLAFRAIDRELVWEGNDQQEVGRDAVSGEVRVRVNPHFYRPAEVELVIGNPEKVRRALDWKAETSLEQLCRMMVEADLQRISGAPRS